MTTINRSALVPYSANQMFQLVDDIEKYADFLPWCKSTQILSREKNEVTASIEIAKAGFNKTFTTKNFNSKNKIELNLVEGPFKSLHGFWRFTVLDETACKVSLDIEFHFSNRLISMTLEPIFSQICNSLINAFVDRAAHIYSK